MNDIPGAGGITIKTRVIALSTLVILVLLACIAFADQPVPAVPETQGLVTTTGADVLGIATEMDAGAWTLTNDPLVLYTYSDYVDPFYINPTSYTMMLAQLQASGGSMVASEGAGGGINIYQVNIPQALLNVPMAGWSGETWQWFGTTYFNAPAIAARGIHTGGLDPGQVQYTTAYDASVLAQAGHTVLLKSMNINTGNKVAATQSNLNAQTLLTYIATGDGGNVAGSENLLMDGAGNSTPAWDRMLCPFAGGNNTIIPAYFNIVQAGSAYDLTVGSVTTSADNRVVGTDATVPVALNYNINVKPYDTTSGSIPAMGSVSAYIKAHIQEARGQTAYNVTFIASGITPYSYMLYDPPVKAEDLQYSETTSATGVISSFAKSMSYSSQATSTPLKVIPVNVYETTPP